MHNKKLFLFFIPILFITLIIAGCSSNSTSKDLSKNELTDLYAKSISNYADVITGYAKTFDTKENYVASPADKQISWIKSTQNKLKNYNPTKKNEYFDNYLKDLKKITHEYKTNDFSSKKSIDSKATFDVKRLKKALDIDNSNNSKLKAAKIKFNKSENYLNRVAASQPQIDGKKVINSAGEITFDSINVVPGYENEKTVEVKYTYKNTTNEAQNAYSALLASGKFTQETDDSVNDLQLGMPDSEWEEQNPVDQQMDQDQSLNKLKSGQEKQYVTFLKVDNDSPITFKAKDPETNESIGKIKLSINQ